MNPLLPALEKKIRDCCPELQKLEFGCNLAHEGYSTTTINYVRGTGNGSDFKVWGTNGLCYLGHQIKDGFVRRNSFNHDEWWEILGKPIELQHVLRAMKEVQLGKYPWGIRFDAENDRVVFGDEIAVYDLLKSFHDQDEPFKKWLASILGVESN